MHSLATPMTSPGGRSVGAIPAPRSKPVCASTPTRPMLPRSLLLVRRHDRARGLPGLHFASPAARRIHLLDHRAGDGPELPTLRHGLAPATLSHAPHAPRWMRAASTDHHLPPLRCPRAQPYLPAWLAPRCVSAERWARVTRAPAATWAAFGCPEPSPMPARSTRGRTGHATRSAILPRCQREGPAWSRDCAACWSVTTCSFCHPWPAGVFR